MKTIQLASSLLALGLTLAVPNLAIAHVGHGDEFQAEGGINRVAVNAETDSLLGIVVEPIASAPEGNGGVYIPATALVDGGDKQLVFVQYEGFYEPVPVTTGATQGALIEITEGLSVGEKLVTQGSLSLYAESRKTQTAEAETEEPVVAEAPETVSPAETQSTAPNETQASPPVAAESGLPVLPIALGGLGVIGAGILGLRAYNLSRKGKNIFGK
ncbi:cobalt transporter [Synechocystis sp. PCC 7339]|uniref:cobalt transporter n=1 Tax=Synechocystis sp. PCC 7339 TaxID=2782213 RepID=UPI001CC1640B|nr:cobalt transporter [Synechocystis sp. PCC 7339]UAJ73080.1 cobalt transporter [Synechocystis sp. PCC 7339]